MRYGVPSLSEAGIPRSPPGQPAAMIPRALRWTMRCSAVLEAVSGDLRLMEWEWPPAPLPFGAAV